MNQPITYSSLISLSMARYQQIYVYTDGFMSNEFNLQAFNIIHGNLFLDFQNSVFRIIPVINFKWTQKILRDIVYGDFAKLQNEQAVKERKNLIQGMKTNLDGEVTSNISLTNKLTGTPLIFGSSQFMLVHVTSLKFFTLNDDNQEDLKFQLKDFPEEGSVLKFQPCLNFQKLRTNIVYNKDAVYLSSVKTVCNRPPSLFNTYKGIEYKYKESKDKKLKKQFENEVKQSKTSASIEYSTRWRVEAYYTASLNDTKKDDYLHVGDVIALYLSEMKLYLNALKPYEPFKKILQILNIENLNTGAQINDAKKHLLKKTFGSVMVASTDKSQKNDDQKTLKKILIDDVLVAFQDFVFTKPSERNKAFDLPNSCFWKIESSDQMSGGLVDWDRTYRLRHFQTGRYLSIYQGAKWVEMELVSIPTDRTLFKFVQIQNSEDQESLALKKDTFFYLRHMESGIYLGISDEVTETHAGVQKTMEEQEVMLKQGYLSVVQNHYTTFRMKKIDFGNTWETSMLQYSLPYFLEAIGHIQQLQSQNIQSCINKYNDEDVRNKLYFYQIFQRVMKTLDTYSEFVNNKLVSNISPNQEYSMVVPSRQNIVREQNIFILLVWMLFRCFPDDEIIERQTQSYDQMLIEFLDEKDFMFKVQSYQHNKTLEQHHRMLFRLVNHHDKRMLVLAYKVYLTLQDFCIGSKHNQKTLMKLINIIQQHIGKGNQVVETLINSISKTPSILSSLPKTNITVQVKEVDENSTIQIDENQKVKKEQTNVVQAIIQKLLDYPPFTKPDIIKLLAAICSSKGKPIYVNQNLIYRSFIENKTFYNHAFMKLTYKVGELLISYNDRNNQPYQIKFLEFFDEAQMEKPNHLQYYEYLKNQLSLIANLCLSRNATACQYFQQIFVLQKLISYVNLDKLDSEIKAVILRLIKTLYIDQEPYQPQKRPELVREILFDSSILTRKIHRPQTGFLSLFQKNSKFVTIGQLRILQKRELITSETILYQTLRKKKQIEREILLAKDNIQEESEVEESEEMQKHLYPFIETLLQYIETQYNQLQLNMVNQVFNIMTLEVIEIISILLQFGLFNQNYRKDVNDKSDIEKIVRYLAYFLEYDENYFKALQAIQIQRKFQEQKKMKEDQQKKNAFNDFPKIDINVMGLLDEKTIKKARKAIYQDTEMEIINDPLFKKVKGLKKILDKCSNKTYTMKEDEQRFSCEIEIKIEICNIFIYLIDMRQDFLIDNAIDYFKNVYVPYSINQLQDLLDFKQILPEKALQIGQDIEEIKGTKLFTHKNEIVKHLDVLLERPFYEVLMLALYFSTNPQLQNMIVQLIQRYSSQRQILIQHLTDLQVVIAPEIIQFYKKWSRMLNKLKRNVPNCQAWLQLDTPQKLNGRNEINFEKNLTLIKKIIDVFQENQGDSAKMRIKQRIFKHVGGFDSLLILIESCMVMLSNNKTVFQFKEPTTNFQIYQQNLAKKILRLLEYNLQIMQLFSRNSMENQELVYNKLIFNLCHYRKNNFGQIKFLNELFNDNPKLTQHISKSREIECFFKLIKRHGRYSEFLDFFNIQLQNAQMNATGQSDVISMFLVTFILMPKYYDYVCPISNNQKTGKSNKFYEHDPQSSYKGKFFIILSQCLKNFIGVSLLNRAQQSFTLEKLLKALVDISREEQHSASEQFDQMHVKTSIIEIILILLEKTEKVNQEIIQCSSIIQDFIALEIQFLNSRTNFALVIQTYLFKKQSPFLLKYFRIFLKDANAQIFSSSDTQKQERRRINEYGKAFLLALTHMNSTLIQEDLEKMSVIMDIFTVLKLEIPKTLKKRTNEDEEQDEEDTQQPQNEELVNKYEDALVQLDAGQKEIQQTENFQNIPLINNKGAKGFLSKFKSLKQKSMNDRKDETDDDEARLINNHWQQFVSLISDNHSVLEYIKEEKQTFSKSVWDVAEMFQSDIKQDQRDLILNQEDIVKNLLQYLLYAQQNNADKKCILFVIVVLKSILKVPFKEEDFEELKERQEIMNKLNATKIAMQLLWGEKDNNLEYLTTLLSFFCMLLKCGNLVVQTTIYDYCISNYECEKLFFKLQAIIQNYINSSPAELKQQGKLQTKLIVKTLQFMQLLCEGHNTKLQNYLHYQSNSKNSYDLVILIVKLIQCVKIDNKNYSIVVQCMDTLTETVQGPCKANQIALSNSKYLEYVVDILSENEQMFDCQEVIQTQEPKLLNVIFKEAQRAKLKNVEKIAQPRESIVKRRMKLMKPTEVSNITLHLAKLARLKLKALVSLVSLVECVDSSDNIILRIIRAIPTKVLTNNMQRVFQLMREKYKNEYLIEVFGGANSVIDFKVPEEDYELIIEIGFQIYILMQTFISSKKGKDILQEDIEMREILTEFEVDKQEEEDKGLFGGISQLGGQFLNIGLGGFSKLAEGLESAMKSEEQKRKEKEQQEQQEKEKKKQELKDAIRFFKKHSCSIEIVRQEQVYQVYFPKLPFCDQLPKDLKVTFHDDVNRESIKSKLTYLIQQSKQIIDTMKHEERLRILFNINPLLGAIASQGKLWELCLFLTTCAINLAICFSYSQYFYEGEIDLNEYNQPVYTTDLVTIRLYEPRLFFIKELTITKQIIIILGIIDLVFSSMIVFFFMLKRAPLKVAGIWKDFFNLSGFIRIIVSFIKNVLVSMIVLLQDFDILYYSAFILAGIVGLAAHPFLFCVHLMEFLKMEQLKTVIKAMWYPRLELALALMLLLILEYYATILAWMVYYMEYPNSEKTGLPLCNEFWRCFVTTFDWTFKFTGSIGAHLADPQTSIILQKQAEEEGVQIPEANGIDFNVLPMYYLRFIFDNVLNITLVFILLNMIQGIIIDTFGSLKDSQAEKNKDMKFTCFICGFDMETLDKSTDVDKGFNYHIQFEHHMWNYIFFIAWIYFKDSTELDGYESYVYSMMENQDLGWMPMNMARSVQEEEMQDKAKFDALGEVMNEVFYFFYKFFSLQKSSNLDEQLNKLMGRLEKNRNKMID